MDESLRQLRVALSALPHAPLHHASTADGSREIRSGDQLVFRHDGSPKSELYAAVLDTVVAAAPSLSDTTEPVDRGGLETLVADVLKVTTRLHPSFAAAPLGLLSKLLTAGLETSSPFPRNASADEISLADIRLAAVNSFCEFLLRTGDSFEMPSEQALSLYAERWNALSNSAMGGRKND